MQKQIHLFRTTNTALAAYLGTIGVPLYEPQPKITTEVDTDTQSQQTTWQFMATHTDGTPTSKLAADYENDQVAGGDTDHPQFYAAAAVDNYRLMVKATKSDHPLVRVKHLRQVWTVPKGGKRYKALLKAGGQLVPSGTSTQEALAS